MMTAAPTPLQYMGDGDFKASPRGKSYCDKHYVVGLYYPMTEWQDRSLATHNHEFAWLAEAWRNLPENLRDLYPTAEHLRKRALIEAGYYDEEIIDVGTKAGALRVAAYARKRDDFAFVVTRGTLVVVRSAKSQSRRAMDRKTFQESKEKILEIVSAMISVSPRQMEREAAA